MLNALLLATCAALGQLSLRGQTHGIDYLYNPSVSGNYAFYGNDNAGLLVLDVSDPTNPTSVKHYAIAGETRDTYLDGNMLYVANSEALQILDVSTPTEPTFVGSFTTSARSVIVEGTYAYVGTTTEEVQVVDVSNPASPLLVGAISGLGLSGQSNTVQALALSGDYLYAGTVGQFGGDLVAVSVVNKASPVVMARISGLNVQSLVVSGTTLYVAESKVFQVDITDPASSFVQGSQMLAGYTYGLFAQGGQLYAKQNTIIIVLDEMTHAELGRLSLSGRGTYVVVVGGLAYTGGDFLEVVDVLNPASLSVFGTWKPVSTYAYHVTVSADGATAFVSDSSKGLLIFDVTQPAPVLIATFAATSCQGHAMRGMTVYLIHSGGVTAIDVNTPSSPSTVAAISTSASISVKLEGTKLYTITYQGALTIYDVTNPTPSQVGAAVVQVGCLSIGVVGDYIYVGLNAGSVSVVGSVLIFDATNIASPSQVAYTLTGLPTANVPREIVRSGSYAYVAFTEGGLVVLDVTNPAAPTVASIFDSSAGGGPYNVESVALDGNTAYLAQRANPTLAVVDITDPLSPSLITTGLGHGNAGGVTVHGGRVYLADKGLFIFDTSAEIGCFKSNVRFLTYAYGAADNTPAKCKGWCKENGHTYAGVENGAQCWCGDSASGSVKTVSSECEATACTGDASDHCGAGYRVRLFSLRSSLSQPTPEEVGCFSTDESPRKLDVLAFVSDKTTVEECTSACEWNGYKYAGLEYGDECWCGNTLPGARVWGDKCVMPCTGDASQVCGNGFRANVYVVDGSSVPVQPTPERVGCFSTDESPKQLDVLAYAGSGNTVEKCAAVCNHNGYKYAGLEYGDECWCGNALPGVRVGREKCVMPCAGDASQMCGGGLFANVYVVDGSSVAAVNKNYEGCFTDSASRILPVLAFRDGTWCTVDECVAVCAHNGHAFAGLEARRECWCGATLPVGTPLADGNCKLPCTGNSAELCGYAWRSSVYSVVV